MNGKFFAQVFFRNDWQHPITNNMQAPTYNTNVMQKLEREEERKNV